MIYCDVCDTILVIKGNFVLDEEEIRIICPECGFDNTYQFVKRTLSDEVDDFIDATEIIDDELLMIAMSERFGINYDDLNDMILEKEIVGWDIRIRRT